MIFAYNFKRFIVFSSWLFTVPGKNDVKCLEVFREKPVVFYALSTAPGNR